MKRKLLYLSVLLILISTVSIANASDIINANLFKGSIVINNVEFRKTNDPLNDLVYYNERTYVPVREFVERTNGRISYDGDKNQISIVQGNDFEFTPEISNENKDNNFSMSIHSQKETYPAHEPIKIFAALRYLNDESLLIQHGQPVIKFTIKDESGFTVSSSVQDVLSTTKVNPFYQTFRALPYTDLENYNYFRSGEENYLKMAQPWLLPKGTYTIEAASQYITDESDTHSIKTSLTIVVD